MLLNTSIYILVEIHTLSLVPVPISRLQYHAGFTIKYVTRSSLVSYNYTIIFCKPKYYTTITKNHKFICRLSQRDLPSVFSTDGNDWLMSEVET